AGDAARGASHRPRHRGGARSERQRAGADVHAFGGWRVMVSSRAVGAGAFVVVGVLLFTTALFLIGSRRSLFQHRFPVYTEFARLGQLEPGATVRVAGLDAGEVTDIEIPTSPSQKFRVKMEIRDDLHPLIRTDSVAMAQSEGIVGAVF